MDKKISNFIAANKTFSYCTSINNMPHCATCFYAYLTDEAYLIFKSDKEAQHINNAIINNIIAGTILPDINKVGNIKGIQFKGIFLEPEAQLLEMIKKTYYKKYPFSLTMPGNIYAIEIKSIKMTDNTLGFGKKLLWEK